MTDWNSFLVTQGATLNTEGHADFHHPDFLNNATHLMPLQQGLLAINGPEAAKFLQGQVTCDVRELEQKVTRLGAQCNIKGRMLQCFRALQTHSEQIILRMHPHLITNGLQSFGKYVVFSKAKLADISNEYRCIGIAGPNAASILTNTFNINFDENDQWQFIQNSLVIRINEHRFECWLNPNEAEKIWAQLAPQCVIAGQNMWALLNIQNGLGDITPNTLDAFTPQAINFQLTNGINFRKGCYTGQEIVARLHYRGSLKRHMYRFEFLLEGNDLPASGESLHNSEGKTVGDIIVVAQKTSTTAELLACVIDDQCNDSFLSHGTQKLSLLSLPYAIPNADEAD